MWWCERGRGKGRSRQASLRRCPGYRRQTKVTASWSVQDPGLLPTLPAGQFLPAPSPHLAAATLSPPRDPVPDPTTPLGSFTLGLLQCLTPVLTRPWGSSGALHLRVLGHWHWAEGCGPLVSQGGTAAPSRWLYRVPQRWWAPRCCHPGQR